MRIETTAQAREALDRIATMLDEHEYEVSGLQETIDDLKNRSFSELLKAHVDHDDRAYIVRVLAIARKSEPFPFRQKTLDKLIDAMETNRGL